MVKKMQRKFIILSVSSVFVVLTAIAGIINVLNYLQIEKHAEELLTILSDNDGIFPKIPNKREKNKTFEKMSPETPFATRFFTIKTDKKGMILSIDTGKISSITSNDASAYASAVLAKTKTSGFYNNYKYKILTKEYGNLLIFIDCNRDLKMFQSFLMNSIVICALGITAVFLLVLIFSKRAISPIRESYEKQKQFITDASHELKTPLAIISANADVLEIEYGEGTPIRSIRNQVDRLSSLITSLVSLTRMDEEHNLMLKVDFSLSDAITETATPFLPLFEQRDMDLVLNVTPNLTYHGDEEALRRVVTILLDNAVKYAQGKHVHLSLRKQGKRTLLALTNKAQNLEIKNYDLLFERFYRNDLSRNGTIKGYGIGLCIAKAIISKHNGSIHAFSKDGMHLTFLAKL